MLCGASVGQGNYLKNGVLGAFALILAGARLIPGTDSHGPSLLSAAPLMAANPPVTSVTELPGSGLLAKSTAAVRALATLVRPLSHPTALAPPFRSYFAYMAAHPREVKKPVLYFVDYGLPSTQPRGYVFDMQTLKILEGPFAVAHGRGSSTTQYGVPTRFSNAPGSAATSLGLYLAENTYDFHGHTGGRSYSSIGLRLRGVSENFNTNALARGVVAHGAPYVTADKAGRREGCPAIEQERARRVVPALADGGMVFLFAPDQKWMTDDPWIGRGAD